MNSAAPSIASLIERLALLPGSDRLFNPYDDQFPGARIRRDNLARYLTDMLARRPRTLMLFEAPGYRGCALSGVPVTSERIMLRGIPTWALFGAGYQGTSGQVDGVSEMTATILWNELQDCADQPPLVWNTVPLHPYRPGERQSNRAPSADEQRMGLAYVEAIIALFDPRTVLAVGKIAQHALDSLGRPMTPLRHPSQGGKPEFARGLRQAFGKSLDA